MLISVESRIVYNLFCDTPKLEGGKREKLFTNYEKCWSDKCASGEDLLDIDLNFLLIVLYM